MKTIFLLLLFPFLALSAFAAPGLEDEVQASNKVAEIAGKFHVSWPTLTAQVVNFLIVAFLLYKFAVKPVLATMDERQTRIEDGLRYTEEMKLKLEQAEQERAATIKAASAEAQRLLVDAGQQGKELIERRTAEAAAKAENMLKKAAEAAEIERNQMLAEVRQEVARLVVATSAKVLERELSDTERRTYAERAAGELAGRN